MATTYVTQSGDSLWSIAQRFYGDGAQWNTIYHANTNVIGVDPNIIHAGLTLTIPDAHDSTQPGQTYVTTDTDTLWSIAQRFYGDGTKWTKIYAANQAVVGTDPNVLHGGFTLHIPA